MDKFKRFLCQIGLRKPDSNDYLDWMRDGKYQPSMESDGGYWIEDEELVAAIKESVEKVSIDRSKNV